MANAAKLFLPFIVGGALAMGSVSGRTQELQNVEVKSRLIENFQIGSSEKRFGPLEFAGGLEMVGTARDFGAWSGIALAEDQKRFVGVADTGFWIWGTLERNDDNNVTGLTAWMTEIVGEQGEPITAKWQADAEGIAWRGDEVLVSYERAHRISSYQFTYGSAPILKSESAPHVPLYELRQNRGFEGIALAPATSPMMGALIGISEKSLDKSGNIMGFVEPLKGEPFEFSLRRKDEYDVTDIAFLPTGDLLVLERRFNVSDGIGMRIRQIQQAEIVKGATVDGPTLLEADLRHQIDNIEGMDVSIDPDGTPRLTLVSDDNHSLLQRNLLLEFRLVENLN